MHMPYVLMIPEDWIANQKMTMACLRVLVFYYEHMQELAGAYVSPSHIADHWEMAIEDIQAGEKLAIELGYLINDNTGWCVGVDDE